VIIKLCLQHDSVAQLHASAIAVEHVLSMKTTADWFE